jgi:hypothetical protein
LSGEGETRSRARALPRLGAARVLEAVEFLKRNDWLELDMSEGRTRVRLGERARRQLEEATAAVT